MKTNYTIIILLFSLFHGVLSAQEAQKNFINYQGVARNASNELMVDETMTITIGLKFGAANASAAYEEDHTITTDANGVFSLLIGNGNAIVGNYNTLSWGSSATFVTVAMNGNEVGTTQMMAVPYAISSGDAKQEAAEVPYDNTVSGLSATTAQEAIDELVGDGIVDADADPTNEIQTISFDSATNELSLSDGGSVTIPSGGTDADADPENELQTLSFDTGTNELSLSDGNSVTIPTGGTDADADPTNEIQTISFDATTNELSLSDGGSVTIPSGGTDADADPTNEIQDISLSGTELSISDGSTIDLAPIVPLGGTDNQELTFNETTSVLEIEDGNSVDLSSLSGSSTGASLWDEDEEGVSRRAGMVAIGHQASRTARLFVQNTLPDIRNGISASVFNNGYKVAISARAEARGSDANNTFGVRSNARAESTGTAWAYRGDIGGAGTGRKYGLDLIFYDGTGGEKYGIYSKGEDKNYFSGDLGVGIEDPEANLDIAGDARIRSLSGTGQRNVMADANGNLVIGSSGGGSSVWATNGDNINYDSGNVGIGTNSPNTALHINTTSAETTRFQTSNERNYISFHNSEGYQGYSGIWTGDNDMDFGTGLLNFTGKVHLTTNASPKLTVATNGDVGIGTQNPTTKLDVRGDIKTSGEVHGSGTGDANMIPVAYGSIDRDGRIFTGSGNFTVQTIGAGVYRVFIVDEDFDFREYIASATRTTSTTPGLIGINSATSLTEGGYMDVRSYDVSGNLQSTPFSFVVYKP